MVNSQQYRRLLRMFGSGLQRQEASAGGGVEPALALGAAEEGAGGSAKGVGGSGAANDGCAMCEFVVQYIKIAIANNETVAQILHSLDRACETFSIGSGGQAGE